MQSHKFVDPFMFFNTHQIFPLKLCRSTLLKKPPCHQGFENRRESENEGAMGEVKNDQ